MGCFGRADGQKRGSFIWTCNVLKKHGVRVWAEFLGLVLGSWPVYCKDFEIQREKIFYATASFIFKKGLLLNLS